MQVNITLDEETAAWAHACATEHNTTVSRMIEQMLRERMQQLSDYDRAMHSFLKLRPVKLNASGKRYAARDSLHDRSRTRR